MLVYCNLVEILPGEEYSEYKETLKLLARDCVGGYEMTSLEDSLIFGNGIEGHDKINDREGLCAVVVKVAKLIQWDWLVEDQLYTSV